MPALEANLLISPDDHFAVVVSRFNDLVTTRLLEGAVATLKRHGAKDDQITTAWVPGSFEIPVVADRLASSGKYAAVITLGAVIQGETSHHEYINAPMASALMQIGLKYGRPVLFGVLTCHSMEQALDRAGGKAGNKGVEAALAAIETVNLLRQCAQPASPRTKSS
ncbi:6,7-dimethyl-8-ribityllumazine synthase [Caulifigura coniformis]|uniref:6,7-dimethyl-8-ribityllumazine synthase n=1 Tax=Caulifigura coniformis TaxID=2527983 RepID=A0A517SHG5_9PLAN|nr:6,7-dimethyl-8-ribityllumazine synthase [Caulifigura coniformis]QDT55562.1 6,7-dimethyl-8-ribityllumazine synthase [Caulifigura coniformis]